MQTAREKAISVIMNLPEDTPMDEIVERLLFIEMVERGVDDLNNGRIVKEDAARKTLEKWLK